MTDENRRFSRIPFKVNTILQVGDTEYRADEMSNLSVGGCLLPISVDLPPSTPCQICIFLEGTSDEIKVMVEGEIIRSTPEGVAVKFNRIDPQSLFHLHNIIRYNSPDADMIEFEISKHPGLK